MCICNGQHLAVLGNELLTMAGIDPVLGVGAKVSLDDHGWLFLPDPPLFFLEGGTSNTPHSQLLT